MKTLLVCLVAVMGMLAGEATAQRRPVRIFLLVGQSNMEGKGAVRHLETLIKDPETRETFKHLKKGSKWVKRKDVWIAYDRQEGGRQVGNLTVGYGCKKDQIGAELGFGLAVGDHLKDQVLLIKCCWGGASLKENFLPPGSGGPGPYYLKMLNEISLVLSDLKSHFPGYRGQGFEISGMVWFQGWNDAVGGGNADYTKQLAQFIRDVRNEFKTPDLPVVIGELGQAGVETTNDGALKFREQQQAVAELDEFKGTVRFVKTSVFVDPRLQELFDIWRKCKGKENEAKKLEDEEEKELAKKAAWSEWEPVREEYDSAASDRPYHYFGSGRIFYMMGDAFGRAMVELLSSAPPMGGKKTRRRTKLPRAAVVPNTGLDHVAERQKLQPEIDQAIDSGAERLLSRQLPDGSWANEQERYGSGQTALCVYTLLKCGFSPADPNVRRGLKFLDQHFPTKTYSFACQLMAYEATSDRKYHRRIAELVEKMLKIQNSDGGWGYDGDRSDLSNTQYAALGLRAASLAGIRFESKVLHDLASYAMTLQERPRKVKLPNDPRESGDRYRRAPQEGRVAGFVYMSEDGYPKPGDCRGSMTTAGISVLAIVQDCFGKRRPRSLGRRSRAAIQAGLNWLLLNWSVTRNPNGGYHYYYLYGLERVGGLLMREIIARHAWYLEGARVILKNQEKDGSWDGQPESSTCFALLFLRRATWHRGGVTGRSRGPGGHTSSGGQVHLMGSGGRSLAVWVQGFSPNVTERFKVSLEDPDIRILKVEYLVDGKVVSTVSGDMSHPWRGETHAGIHKFSRNGSYDVTAHVHVLPPGSKTHDADTKVEVLKSNPFVVTVRTIADPMREEIAQAISQDLLRGAKIKCKTSSRKEKTPKHAARFIHDGLLGTHWICAKTDEQPMVEMKFRDDVRARYVIVAPAGEKANCDEIESIEISVNNKSKKWVAHPEFPRSSVRFDLKKRRNIESIRIRIQKKKPGKESSVGLAEIYFYR